MCYNIITTYLTLIIYFRRSYGMSYLGIIFSRTMCFQKTQSEIFISIRVEKIFIRVKCVVT